MSSSTSKLSKRQKKAKRAAASIGNLKKTPKGRAIQEDDTLVWEGDPDFDEHLKAYKTYFKKHGPKIKTGENYSDMFNAEEKDADFMLCDDFAIHPAKAKYHAKRFTKEHVQWASKMKFLYKLDGLKRMCKREGWAAPKAEKEPIIEKATVYEMLKGEGWIEHVPNPNDDQKSRDVYLVIDDI